MGSVYVLGKGWLRLGGKKRRWLAFGGNKLGWGKGFLFYPTHAMRSTSAARQCRVWNIVTLVCCIDVGCCYVFDLASMFLSS